MYLDRRKVILAASLVGLASATGAPLFGAESGRKLYRTAEPEALLAATRALITDDTIATFITVDEAGQPRARSVLASPPDDGLTLWIGTRKGSRKLGQIASNPASTLHFAEDAKSSYLSLMGESHAQTDPEIIKRRNPYKGDQLKRFFPNYPDDFVLIGFKPHWLEIMTNTLAGQHDTWQPQGLEV